MRLHVDAEYLFSADAGPIPNEDDCLFMKTQEEYFNEYWDDVNGGWSDAEKVQTARKEELDWILRQEVFEKVPTEEC